MTKRRNLDWNHRLGDTRLESPTWILSPWAVKSWSLFVLVFCCLFGATCQLAAQRVQLEPGTEFNWETWEDFRLAIMPEPEELEWRKIPWEVTLWDGIERANREEKPLLIWAMNGHPLGCT